MKPIASASLLNIALLGGVAVGSLFAGAFQANAEVGVAAAVNIDAKGRPPGAAPRVITLGSNVVFNEEITTDAAGLVQILLLDGTTFTVGPNSQLTIDEFVYDPNTGDAKVVASLTKGVFRFVGARTSQTEGGATVKTPVGTIGIRGGVANFSCDAGECKASLVAGKSLTIVDGDGTQRIVYETGYTAVITRSEGGGTTTTVRKSTKEETGLIQQQLAGKPGQTGGAGNPPTDETVANSQVGQNNSGLPDNMTVPGSPKPVQSSDPSQVEQVAGIDGKTQDDLDNDIKNETPTANARLLTAPAGGYVVAPVNGGGTVPNPGTLGLVGSTPASDRNVQLVQGNGRLRTSDGSLDLPDYSGAQGDEGLESIDIGPGGYCYPNDCDTASLQTTPLGGTAYAGAGDFVAYMLGFNGNPTQPVYVIYGTPTANPQSLFTDSNVVIREYALTEDPIGQSPVPFFREDIYTLDNNYSSTNLIIVESQGGMARAFQSWVHISGEGDQQRSAAFVFASGVSENGDGNLMMDGGRRGTYRANANGDPFNMRGGVATIAGAAGGHFFGDNAEHFVIGATPSPADVFSDGSFETGIGYGTHHVASLVQETPLTEYGQPGQPTRTDRTVTGFMSGMVESSSDSGANPYIVTSNGATNLTMALSTATNTVSAQSEVFNTPQASSDVHSLVLAFGSNAANSGNSAFVDDHVFGARRSSDTTLTGVKFDAQPSTLVEHVQGSTPGSYLVSGRANPIVGYQHLVSENPDPDYSCSDCDFIDWGWWGTRDRVGQNTGSGQNIRDEYVHMGTWVAGELTDPAGLQSMVLGELPFGGTAYYQGTALGSVNNDGAQYIASGTVDMTYHFADRYGEFNMLFDGHTVGGNLNDDYYNPTGNFSGGLSGSSLTGTASGTFVDNPSLSDPRAAGAIGDFSLSGANYLAVGTFATVGSNPF